MTGIAESKTLSKHILCDCKYKFNCRKCNLNQKWNKDKCWCNCKNPVKDCVYKTLVKMMNILEVL